MGLIKAGMGALGGTLADQWKEFFYCDSLDKDVLMVKGQKRTSRRSSNNGEDNIITNGSGIAVADGQCMLIVEQGRVVEVCAEPGEFTFDASTGFSECTWEEFPVAASADGQIITNAITISNDAQRCFTDFIVFLQNEIYVVFIYMKPFLTVYSTLLASPSTLFSHNISYAVSVMIKRFGNIRLICSEEAGAIYTCYCHTHCNSASELTQPIHYLFHFFSFF